MPNPTLKQMLLISSTGWAGVKCTQIKIGKMDMHMERHKRLIRVHVKVATLIACSYGVIIGDITKNGFAFRDGKVIRLFFMDYYSNFLIARPH
jgi:hypothetical protein